MIALRVATLTGAPYGARQVMHAIRVLLADDDAMVLNGIVAEGIETTEDMEMLQRLGVRYGQGYYLGRPSPLS